MPTASLGAAEGVSAAGPGWGCRLHPTAAPAAAGLPSPSPLSASRGCCSRLFPPPPSRCRFHGNRLGCTPVPRCAPGTRCRPWAPPAPTWGSGSPKWLPFGHGQRGTAWGIQKWVLAWHGGGLLLRWGKQTPSAPPPTLAWPKLPTRHGAVTLLLGGVALSSVLQTQTSWHPFPRSEEDGHGEAGRTAAVAASPAPSLPRDGTGMAAAGRAGQSPSSGARVSGRAAVPAQRRPAASRCR